MATTDPRYLYRDFDAQLIEDNKGTLNLATDTFEQKTGANAANVLIPSLRYANTMAQSDVERLIIGEVAPERLNYYRKMCSEYDRGTSILIVVVHPDPLGTSLGMYHAKRVPHAKAQANH